MDSEKKIYLSVAVISIVLSVACHLFLGATSETEVWKKTSIQAIVDLNRVTVIAQKQAEQQKKVTGVLSKLKTELESLKDPKIDKILGRYFNKGK